MQQAFWANCNPIHPVQDYAREVGASNENRTHSQSRNRLFLASSGCWTWAVLARAAISAVDNP